MVNIKNKVYCYIATDGSKYYYLDDDNNIKYCIYHREDGPANEYANGDKAWYIYGKLHREDGPAIQYVNGNKYWYLNDVEYSFEEWDRLRKIPSWLL